MKFWNKIREHFDLGYYKKEPDYKMTSNGEWVEFDWADIILISKLIKDNEKKDI